ncbi:MAG TPA: PIG-L family deacetylase [Acidimicrobiales bacterium]|nr:PIG-L family deacetylase [Acidimicrobiales bacterium]
MTTEFSRDLPTPRRALAIGAHPDDVDFGCGGTLAKWASDGCSIHHLVCTDGSKGSWDADDDEAELVVTRQAEQQAASRALGGAGDVVFLGWRDGELESGLSQRSTVAYWIRKLRPEVVLGHDPWRRYRLHPDHRHAGFLVVDGIVAARDPHFFPEHGAPAHRPSTLLLWEADEPDHVENITEHLDRKLEALMTHRSQFRSTMKIDDPASKDQVAEFHKKVTDRAATSGAAIGVTFGEQFKAVREL